MEYLGFPKRVFPLILLLFFFPVYLDSSGIIFAEQNDSCVRCHTDAKLIDELVASNRSKHLAEAAG